MRCATRTGRRRGRSAGERRIQRGERAGCRPLVFWARCWVPALSRSASPPAPPRLVSPERTSDETNPTNLHALIHILRRRVRAGRERRPQASGRAWTAATCGIAGCRSYAVPGGLGGLSALKANAAAAPPSNSATM
jgi:hypothetical protein